MALAAAAVDDVTAWTVFAFIVAGAEAGSLHIAGYTILLLLLYVMGMLFLVRPALSRLFARTGKAGGGDLAVVLFALFVSALATQAIGIHALFGAFFAGLVMPHGRKFHGVIYHRLEYFAAAFLMPMFFAVTGVRTQVGLLNSPTEIAACLMILLVAIAGKLGGVATTSRALGMGWREALTLGTLMNTRGLMELIVLSVGYEMGIFTQTMFAMMVLMTLITTVMTGPLLSWFGADRLPKGPSAADARHSA
jgi:Kef-type K+ transport system membrane component KefB